jgi:hypothetical protein
MGIGVGDVVGGAMTGGLYNVAKATGLFGGSKTTSQEPLETPEQRAARQKLLNFANTGKFGDFQAGAEVPLNYGDYHTTGAEDAGLSSLQRILQNGLPAQFGMGDAALQDLLSGPNIDASFQPFKDLTDRQLKESQDALKRSAGFAGNLYSTDTVRQLGNLQQRGNETITAKLADLTNQALDRKLQAIPLAYQAGQAEQAAGLGQVAASQQFGDLTRSLNDQKIKARDAELLRRRTELQQPIQAAESVAGMNVPFGVPSVTTSPYQQLLGLVGQVGGTALGSYLGGPVGGAAGGSVGGSLGRSVAGYQPSFDFAANPA